MMRPSRIALASSTATSPVLAPLGGLLLVQILISLEQALVDPTVGPLGPVGVGGVPATLRQLKRWPKGGFAASLGRLRPAPFSRSIHLSGFRQGAATP